uniref:AAA family ATPase n=1 Tax=Candidatus Desulfatibia profunda TaxID=2841695 RepID=A0A8J6NVF0_9BACT|nr:AAA family ATPase [Candidatus Desulfatibia profunda]
MSNFSFRPAVRENVGLIIGLIGPSGSGKTYSALRLAIGLSGGKKPAGIDTEACRMKHYADQFKFDHGELMPPFRPDTYANAIKIADVSEYSVIIVDSCSHEWAGDGGILDWQEEELTRMAGDDWKKRETCKMASWIKPKMSHKQMVQKLLQVKAHLILCFRAEEKTEMVNPYRESLELWHRRRETMEKWLDADQSEKKPTPGDELPNKMIIRQKGWQPICEKNMPYELTMSFLLTPDKPGYPQPIKLQEQHKAAIDLSKPLDEEAGRKLLAWASSSQVQKSTKKESEKQEKKLSGRPLTTVQAGEICKITANNEPPLSMAETKEVIDWYSANNDHGGRTYEAGQALIHGFPTIFDRFLEAREQTEEV